MYYLNTTSNTCTSAVTISACHTLATNTTCLQCINGYGVNITMGGVQCDPCAIYCTMCDFDVRNCSSCISHYGLDYSTTYQTCQPCNTTCADCLDKNYQLCYSCNLTIFYLLNYRCYERCLFYCAICATNNTTCLRCIGGYGVNIDIGSIQCDPCNINCAKCDFDVRNCTLCVSHYGLDNSTAYQTCQPCNATCFNCLDTNYQLCTSCSAGFYLFNYRCYNCVSNCISCTNNTICNTCLAGLTLSSNRRSC